MGGGLSWFLEIDMKIIILAAAALVATTLSAAAAHTGEHDVASGVVSTPGEESKEANTMQAAEANVVAAVYGDKPDGREGTSSSATMAGRMPVVLVTAGE
jgi:hypothetical protein